MSPDAPVDVDTVLDELYALPLEQFVVARNAASKRVKASGDTVGAERVARLPKPTVAAWVVNQVAREHPDEVAALVTIGDELRDATDDRDRGRITALDRLRRERTEALVREVRDAGEVAGRAVSASAVDRLAETLTAAVMDADAGALVRSGRLARALQHVGFGILDEDGEPADVVELRSAATVRRAKKAGPGADDAADVPRSAVEAPAAGAATDPDDPLAAAEREVEESAAEVDRREAARDEADGRAREAGDAVGRAEEDLGRIEDELARLADERDAARARLEEAREAHADARAVLDAADDALGVAEERAAAARKARRAVRRTG
ncbi:hypothetical protein [Cellulosimicrobium marinum]|uniref:hypothetical protein n=1 Tax=Cellulosimicrobium marinum TaxID=1638992 RepID=UPI001E482EE8|nr:hypothetical protein [Cellulosimicrobium marinum]MCB7136063.1 hypothetical protein [Cellulosimicrobium marinum]